MWPRTAAHAAAHQQELQRRRAELSSSSDPGPTDHWHDPVAEELEPAAGLRGLDYACQLTPPRVEPLFIDLNVIL